jgi:hypothetical protein
MTRERKELFSERVSAGSRTYFFDVKESAGGIRYLVIIESRQTNGEFCEHNRVMVFQEHLMAFSRGFKKAFEFMIEEDRSKAYNVEQIRREYPRAYAKWTEEEDIRLRDGYTQGKIINELAKIFQRKPGAIRSRLRKLGLL